MKDRINISEHAWAVVNLAVSGIATVMIFIGGITCAVSASKISTLEAGSAFAFFTAIAWGASTFFAWRAYRGN